MVDSPQRILVGFKPYLWPLIKLSDKKINVIIMVKQTIQIFARVKPTKAKTGVSELGCQLFDMLWFDFTDHCVCHQYRLLLDLIKLEVNYICCRDFEIALDETYCRPMQIQTYKHSRSRSRVYLVNNWSLPAQWIFTQFLNLPFKNIFIPYLYIETLLVTFPEKWKSRV